MPTPTAQKNFTDPDSRLMKRTGGDFDASHNAQTVVDDTAHLIVAAEVGQNASDAGQFVPMLQAVQTNAGLAPSPLLADAGYCSEQNFADLADSPTDIVVAMGRRGKRCAPIKALTQPHMAAMAAKLQTPACQSAYQRRKWLAELPNGWVKRMLGFQQFSLHGLHRVQAELKLACLALNLRRIGAMKTV